MNIVYNDTKLHKGMFFNPDSFSMANYFSQWKDAMLNYGAVLSTFGDIHHLQYQDTDMLFIRPDDDSKSFVGDVLSFSHIKEWAELVNSGAEAMVTSATKVVIGEAFAIQGEWRLWIVQKQVVAASKYRESFRLKKEKGCPQEVLDFALARCREYTPHDVFVMDIGLCGDRYYIIECGCMNSAGFYAADVQAIVLSVTDYIAQQADC